MPDTCRICGATAAHAVYNAREMMFGYRDTFDYFECVECGCLQIGAIPDNLAKYYPSDYYSFGGVQPETNPLKRFLTHQLTRYVLEGKGLGGALMSKLAGNPFETWIRPAKLKTDSKILDVGCGTGKFLMYLHDRGFKNLHGIDPFIAEDISYPCGILIHKTEIAKVRGTFDCVMLHHSFEHMPDPSIVMKSLRGIVKDGGVAVIRIPVASSWAWKNYGTNWVQLDAPRHLHLHSTQSLSLLAKEAGFTVEAIEFDSGSFQFWGSEQYLKDIPLMDPRSYVHGIANSIFTKKAIANFKTRAKELNMKREGDQGCFLLR